MAALVNFHVTVCSSGGQHSTIMLIMIRVLYSQRKPHAVNQCKEYGLFVSYYLALQRGCFMDLTVNKKCSLSTATYL